MLCRIQSEEILTVNKNTEKSESGINREHEFKYILPKDIFDLLESSNLEKISIGPDFTVYFKEPRIKNRPYIYIDSDSRMLLNSGAQLSIRKRERDYFLTFKTGNDSLLGDFLTEREENNLQIPESKGNLFWENRDCRVIQEFEPVQAAYDIMKSAGNEDLKELCSFMVHTKRMTAALKGSGQELFEIAFDRIETSDSHFLYEMELEFKYSKNKISLPAAEQLEDIVLRMLSRTVEEKTGKKFDFNEFRTVLPKFRRVLEQTKRKERISMEVDEMHDWKDGSNNLLGFINGHLDMLKKSLFAVPVMLFVKPHEYKADELYKENKEELTKLRRLDIKKYNQELNAMYLRSRKEIETFAEKYLTIALDSISSSQGRFSVHKFALPFSEYLLLFIFPSNAFSQTEGLSVYQKVEALICETVLRKVIEISGDRDIYSKMQINFGLGNKDAVSSQQDGSDTRVLQIEFFEFIPNQPELNSINTERLMNRCRLNLDFLNKYRNELIRFEGKGPLLAMKGRKNHSTASQTVILKLKGYL